MNRQIKFRGKKTTNGIWVYGSLVYSNDLDAAIYFQAGKGSVKAMEWVYVDPKTIGQFTGLQDCNGQDIYEGDILKDKDWEVFEDKKSFVVSFDEISPRFLLGRTDGRSSIFQLDATFANRSVIIANIHDNPELLKGGEE